MPFTRKDIVEIQHLITRTRGEGSVNEWYQDFLRVLDGLISEENTLSSRRYRPLPSLEGQTSKLSRLVKQPLIVGDPEDLVHVEVGRWRELDRL